MKTINVGIIGLGPRGLGLTRTALVCDECNIVALCDVYGDRMEKAQADVMEKRGTKPVLYPNYKDLLLDPNVDAVIIASSWDMHTRMAVDAMKAGKYTAVEVGGAYDVEDCWQLVRAYEETGTPIMMLENCCFDRFELLCTSLVRAGRLGKVLYCQGAYAHELRGEILGGYVNRHYRLKNYIHRNCENYPTHQLGPIAKILNITSGNRFTKLVSMSSKAVGLHEYIMNNPKYKDRLGDRVFKQGDITTTMIECENGETIFLKLDTTLPRLYERGVTVSGTKGFYCQTTQSVILDDGRYNHESDPYKKTFFNQADYSQYLPADWKEITEEQLKAGHGGMDYIMLKHFFRCLKDKKPMEIDVYEAVTWMSVTALSEQSIAGGSIPVECPDFTRGKYKTRKTVDTFEV